MSNLVLSGVSKEGKVPLHLGTKIKKVRLKPNLFSKNYKIQENNLMTKL